MSKPKPKANVKDAGEALLKLAIAKALEALQDPAVRDKIADHSKVIVEFVQEQWRDRKPRPSKEDEPGEHLDLAEAVGNMFGQGKLEQRVQNLRASIAALRDERQDLAEALAPVATSIDQIGVALEVAGSLPVVKRKRAHRKIDDALDKLEIGLFKAALPVDADD